MRKSKLDFVALIATGAYYVLQKKGDRNREDIVIRREDGVQVEIDNYPYRTNQMPAYVFDELLREGLIEGDGTDEFGGVIFRITESMRKWASQAA